MKIKVLYFGMIAEVIGHDIEIIEISNKNSTVNELIKLLQAKFPKLEDMSFKVALNQSIVEENTKIGLNDEVAILPPFAGG